jgi:hypothetical protein
MMTTLFNLDPRWSAIVLVVEKHRMALHLFLATPGHPMFNHERCGRLTLARSAVVLSAGHLVLPPSVRSPTSDKFISPVSMVSM